MRERVEGGGGEGRGEGYLYYWKSMVYEQLNSENKLATATTIITQLET